MNPIIQKMKEQKEVGAQFTVYEVEQMLITQRNIYLGKVILIPTKFPEKESDEYDQGRKDMQGKVIAILQ